MKCSISSESALFAKIKTALGTETHRQWRSQIALKATHIKGRLLDQAGVLFEIVSLFKMGTSLKEKN